MSSKSSHLLDGRFALDARIGEGTFAEIYRATDTRTGSVVAVKTLRPEHAVKGNAIALFRQEGEIGSSFSHANVVKIWTYGETAGTYFIVMELVTGISLRRRMRRAKRLSVAEALRITRAVLRGLEAIHTAGYIHRDIKPQNILLEANGTPKITDFGITLRAGGIRTPGDGMTLGTAAYIAPEQAAGWEIGPQADLYAAGVVLYEMLTGEVPFPGGDPIEVMHRHMFEPPRDPRSLNPEISPALSAVILRALAKEPEARFPSAQAMHDALEMLHVDGANESRPVRTPVVPKLPATRRKRARIARVPFLTTFVGALLLAVLIIVLALALVSTAVTADYSPKNISNSGIRSGFANFPAIASSTPQAQIQIPFAGPSTRPPDLQLFASAPINNRAQTATPAASPTATATATPSPTPTPKPTATATPSPTPSPKPTATPEATIAVAQAPTPPTQTDTNVASEQPVANEPDGAEHAAPARNKKKQRSNAAYMANGDLQSSNQSASNSNKNQAINSGFGTTQNITNKPDQSTGNPLVSNDSQNVIISGSNSGSGSNVSTSGHKETGSNSRSNDSGGSGHKKHHKGSG